jgi:5,10-methylenetetrahydromethanopterin reductase
VSSIELGLGFQGDKSPNEYAGLARLAESLGFDVLSVYGDLFFQPAIYPLLVMALNTSSVRLGFACLNPFTLHPVEIAGQVAALDAASAGRAFLGLARGAWLDKIQSGRVRHLAALADTLEIVTRLLGGDSTGYSGTCFSLEPGARLAYPVHRRRVPIMIGTWSPGGAKLAARHADELKIGGSANPAMLACMRDRLAAEAARLNRPPDPIGVVMGAVTVIGPDATEVRLLARREVAMYLEVVLELDRTVEAPDGLLPALRQRARNRDWDGAARLIPDDLLDRFTFAGTPEQITRQVEDLARAGARRVDFGTPHGIDEREGITLLGRRVLPNFR